MKGITVDMTGIVFFLLLTGVVFMVGSFFITERLSPSELNKIAELSKDELGRIIDGALADAKSKVCLLYTSILTNLTEFVTTLWSNFSMYLG